MSKAKYLGFTLDQELSFKAHINKLVTKLQVKLGFFFRNRTYSHSYLLAHS